MIVGDFLKALGQIGDPRFRRVLLLGIGLSLLLLAGVYFLFVLAIQLLVPDTVTLPWIGEVGGIDTALSWGSLVLMILLSVFLMMPVASAFTGLFLESVADAVEDRHYPALPPATPLPLLQAARDALGFFGAVVGVNAVALALFLVPPLWPFMPFVFLAANGYLLGREYFTLVAARRVGRHAAQEMRLRHRGTIWLAGVLMAAPLSVPLVNLAVPVLGVATFTHLYHRLRARAASG